MVILKVKNDLDSHLENKGLKYDFSHGKTLFSFLFLADAQQAIDQEPLSYPNSNVLCSEKSRTYI